MRPCKQARRAREAFRPSLLAAGLLGVMFSAGAAQAQTPSPDSSTATLARTGAAAVNEGGSTFFTLTLENAPLADTDIAYELGGNAFGSTARNHSPGDDYAISANTMSDILSRAIRTGTIRIPQNTIAGASGGASTQGGAPGSAFITITIAARDDGVEDAGDTLTLRLLPLDGFVIVNPEPATRRTVTILDPATATYAKGDVVIAEENADSGTFTITLAGLADSDSNVMIGYRLGGNAEGSVGETVSGTEDYVVTADGADITRTSLINGFLDIPAIGIVNGAATATLIITPVDDSEYEPQPQTVTLAINAPSGSGIRTDNTVTLADRTLTIADNDPAPTTTATLTSIDGAEGDPPTRAQFILTLFNPPAATAVVTYSLTRDTDAYDAASPASSITRTGATDLLSIASNSTFTITVGNTMAIINLVPADDTDAADEIIRLTIASIRFEDAANTLIPGTLIPGTAIIGTDGTGMLELMIIDDEPDPTATLSVPDAVAVEDEPGNVGKFRIALTNLTDNDTDVMIGYRLSAGPSGQAEFGEGADYTIAAVAPATLTPSADPLAGALTIPGTVINGGMGEAIINVIARDDGAPEITADEIVRLTLSLSENSEITVITTPTTLASRTITIADTAPPALSLLSRITLSYLNDDSILREFAPYRNNSNPGNSAVVVIELNDIPADTTVTIVYTLGGTATGPGTNSNNFDFRTLTPDGAVPDLTDSATGSSRTMVIPAALINGDQTADKDGRRNIVQGIGANQARLLYRFSPHNSGGADENDDISFTVNSVALSGGDNIDNIIQLPRNMTIADFPIGPYAVLSVRDVTVETTGTPPTETVGMNLPRGEFWNINIAFKNVIGATRDGRLRYEFDSGYGDAFRITEPIRCLSTTANYCVYRGTANRFENSNSNIPGGREGLTGNPGTTDIPLSRITRGADGEGQVALYFVGIEDDDFDDYEDVTFTVESLTFPLTGGGETVLNAENMNILNPAGDPLTTSTQLTVHLTIVDPDEPPVTSASITLDTDPGTDGDQAGPIDENTGAAVITVSLDTTVPAGQTVNLPYVISGIQAEDITAASLMDTLTFIGREQTKTVTLTPVDDNLVEGDETIIFTLDPGNSTGLIPANNTVTVTITDADTLPTARITASDTNADEANNAASTATLTLTVPAGDTVTVSFTLDGTADRGTDYELAVADAGGNATTVTYAAGTADNPHTFNLPADANTGAVFTVTPIADADVENAETVVITVTNAAFSGTVPDITDDTSTTVTIADYGTLPAASLSGRVPMTVDEGAARTADVTITNAPSLSASTVFFRPATSSFSIVHPASIDDPNADYTVTATYSADTDAPVTYASDGGDHSFELPLGIGEAVVTLTATDDGDAERDETFVIEFTRVTFADLGDGTDANFTDGQRANTVSTTISPSDTAGSICGHTTQVLDALMAAVRAGAGDASIQCGAVTPAQLAAIGELDLSSRNIPTLAADDFTGLSGLTTLNLSNTGLTALPAGILDGLNSLTTLDLLGNTDLALSPGIFDQVLNTLTTLSIDDALKGTLSFAQTTGNIALGGTATVTVLLSPAFVAVDVPITVGGDQASNVSATTVTFTPSGTTRSDTVVAATITATADNTATLAFGAAALRDASGETSPLRADSLIVVPGDVHTLTVFDPAGICPRTEQVINAILTRINQTVESDILCSAVTASQLRNLAGALDLQNGGIIELKADDFDNLPNLTELNLSGNGLTTLPAGILDGLDNLTTLNLLGNPNLALSPGIFDGVLDTLTTLSIDGALKGRLSFAQATGSIVLGGTATVTVLLSPAFVAANVTVTVTFGDGASAEHFPDLADRILNFDNDETTGTITVTATATAVPGTTATFAFGAAVLRNADGEISTLSADSLIVVPDDVHILTVITGRPAPAATLIAGRAASEMNNITATATLTLTDVPAGDTVTTVSFTLTGAADRGTDYELAVADAGGNATTVTYAAQAGDAPHTFNLPADASAGAVFTVTPIADATVENAETVVITVTNVAFSVTALNITDDTSATVTITDYGTLPAASLGGREPMTVDEGAARTADVTITNAPSLSTATVFFRPATSSFGIVHPASAGDSSADYTVTATHSAGTDTPVIYTSDGGDHSFELPPGVGKAVVTLTATDDGDAERDETFVIEFTRVTFTDLGDGTDTNFTDERRASTVSTTISPSDTAGSICGRTTQVLDALMAAVRTNESDASIQCGAVTPDQLAAIGELDLSSRNIPTLAADDFTGLSGLTELNLSNTGLALLPAGIFDQVLDTLTTLSIDDALKGRLSFAQATGSIALGGTATVTVLLSPAFVAVDVPITVGGDQASSVSATTVTFTPSGTSRSDTVVAATITATADSTATLAFGAAVLRDASSLPADSLIVVPGDVHTLTVFDPAGICPRTRQVRYAIVAAVRTNESDTSIQCGAVTTNQLTVIEELDLSSRNIPTLAADDFTGLSGLTELNLSNTGLTTLPAGILDGLDSLTTLNLLGNTNLALSPGIFDGVLDTLTTLSIDDALKGTLSFAQATGSIVLGGTATVTVLFSPAFVAANVTVTVTFGDGASAEHFADLADRILNFDNDETIGTITVTATPTAVPGTTVTFAFGAAVLRNVDGEISALSADSLIVVPDDVHTLTVITGKPPPTAALIAGRAANEMNNIAATATLTLTNVPAGDTVTVSFTLDGSADRGTDYELAVADAGGNATTVTYAAQAGDAPHTFNLPADASAGAVFTVTPIADATVENAETVVITVTNAAFSGTALDITDDTSATVTITDYGTLPAASLSGADETLNEGDTHVRTLTLTDAPSMSDATVFLHASGSGPGIDAADYTLTVTHPDSGNPELNGTGTESDPYSFTLPAGVNEATIRVFLNEDRVTEDQETLHLTLPRVEFSDLGDGTNIIDPAVATVTIAASGSVAALTAGRAANERNNVTATATLTLTNVPAGDTVTVSFTLDGAADRNADYELAIADAGGNATTVTYAAQAGDAPHTFNLSADASAGAVFTVTPIADATVENAETVVITVTGVAFSGTAPDITDDTSATVTITDYGTLPAASLSGADETLNEGDTHVRTLTLTDAPSMSDATVFLHASGSGPGIDAADYTLTVTHPDSGNPELNGTGTESDPYSFTLPAGVNEATIRVFLNEDRVTEDQETLHLTLPRVEFSDLGDGTNIIDPAVATVTIAASGSVAALTAGRAANERNNVTATATLTLTNVPAGDTVTVSFTLDGAADRNADYELAVADAGGNATTVTYAAGTADNPHTFNLPADANTGAVFTVTPIADATVENAETVVITVTNAAFSGTAPDITDDTSATVTIADYGTLPAASLSGADETLNEGDTHVRTLTLTDAPSMSDATVFLHTGDSGPGIDAADYTLTVTHPDSGNPELNGTGTESDPYSFTLPAGVNEATIRVFLNEDSQAENQETLSLTLPRVEFSDLGDGTNIIIDPAVQINITINPSSAMLIAALTTDGEPTEENLTTGTFTLRLSNAPAVSDASFDYAFIGENFDATWRINDGAATNISSLTGLLTVPGSMFTGGTADVVFTITPRDDDNAVGERITLTISNLLHGTTMITDIAGNPAQLRITDDDGIRLRIRTFLEGALQ